LLSFLDDHFAAEYDFFYLPLDFKTSQALGYAIVNFISVEAADVALVALQGKLFQGMAMKVERSKSHTGLDSLLQRYQNSSLMEAGVSDEYRPLLRSQGQ